MRYTILALASLLISVLIMLTGSGLLGTVLALRLDSGAWSPLWTGLVLSGYSVGFVVATMQADRTIIRVGHIRAFSAFAAIATAATLIFPMLDQPSSWVAARFIQGIAIAGLYMVIESWLNDGTASAQRGTVLALYGAVCYLGLGGGQFLVDVFPRGDTRAFVLVAFCFALALIPVALTRAPSPFIQHVDRMKLRVLFGRVPVGVISASVAGFMFPGFLFLAPIYATRVGLDGKGIAVFISAAIFGGFLLQWPVGRLSDMVPRRQVIAAISVLTVIFSFSIPFIPLPWLWVGAVLWGGATFPLYPIALALVNDELSKEELVGAGAQMLLVYGIGTIVGPLSGSLALAYGAKWVFYLFGSVAAVHAVFVMYRQRFAASLSVAEQGHYVSVPRTTPVSVEMNPSYDEAASETANESTENKPTGTP